MDLAPLTAPLLRRFVFPSHETRRPPRPDEVDFEVRGVTLRGCVAHPEAERAVVYLGGNGEDAPGWLGAFSRTLPEHATYLVNYRGYGASDLGGRALPSAETIVADSIELVNQIAERHDGRVSLVGRSIGSGIAMQVARQRRVERIVLVTPFDVLTRVGTDISRLPRRVISAIIPDELDSLSVVRQMAATPTLILYADNDRLVRTERTVQLVAELVRFGVPTTTLRINATDHVMIARAPAYWDALGSFLR